MKKRKARIVVDLQPEVATTISAIANEEAQSLYVKQPYSDILKHLRSQWVFNNSPSRPMPGVTEGSPSRKDWDVILYPLFFLVICVKLRFFILIFIIGYYLVEISSIG